MSRLDAKYAKALAQLQRAEARLLRAQNAWQKARETERRLGARLDREPAVRGPKIPGELDYRELDDTLPGGRFVDMGGVIA